jgi:dienelactone hydrolase
MDIGPETRLGPCVITALPGMRGVGDTSYASARKPFFNMAVRGLTMATPHGRPYSILLTLAVLLSSTFSVALAQDASATAPRPLGDEAYQLLTAFYEYDRAIPLEARVVEKRDLPNCTREKIVFRARDSWVVAYLGIPKTGTRPYPCVLALHGLTGGKAGWWEEDDYSSGGKFTSTLLSAGIAVFTPDAQYHGERIADNGFESPGPMVFEKGWFSRFRDMLVQTLIESRRAIDYLETRPEIDAARIGVTGYSMGGIETFALAALDARIKVAVACVTPAGEFERNYDPVIAPHSFARGLAGRPFLMQMGREDDFCTAEQAQRLYDLIPGARKELVFYDAGHRLPMEYVEKAVAWLQDGLK